MVNKLQGLFMRKYFGYSLREKEDVPIVTFSLFLQLLNLIIFLPSFFEEVMVNKLQGLFMQKYFG